MPTRRKKVPTRISVDVGADDGTNSCCIYVNQESDLFAEAKESSYIALDFWPEFKGFSPYIKAQLLKKYPQLEELPVAHIFRFGNGLFPLGDAASDLLDAAIYEAKEYGAPALFATAFDGRETEFAALFRKHGFSDTGIQSSMLERVFAIFFMKQSFAGNPPPKINIERTKGRDSVYYKIEEDLFAEQLHDGARIDVEYQPLGGSVFGLLKFAKDLYGPAFGAKGARQAYLHGIPRWLEHILGEEVSDGLFGMLLQLLRAAIEDARVSGTYMIYTVGPENDESISDRNHMDLLENAGFKATSHKFYREGEQIYIINFREQATNPPPKIIIAREAIGAEINPNADPESCIKFFQEEDLFYNSSKHNYVKVHFRRIVEFLKNVPRLFEAFGQSPEVARQDPHQTAAFISAPTIYSLAPKVASALVRAALNEAESRGVTGVFTVIPLDESGVWTENGFKRTKLRNVNDTAVYVKLFDRPVE